MDPQKYRVKLSDGREFDVTTEGGPPSEEDIMAMLSQQQPEKPQEVGLLPRAWQGATTPIVNLRGEPGSPIRTATEQFAQEHPIIGGAGNFAIDVISGMSSPLNFAFGGLGAGETAAFKLGLPIAQKLQLARRLASAGMGIEGIQNIRQGLGPEGSAEQVASGALELLGGGLGIRKHPFAGRKPTITPEVPIRPEINPEFAKAITEPGQHRLPFIEELTPKQGQLGLPFEGSPVDRIPTQMELPVPIETERLTPPVRPTINPEITRPISTGKPEPIVPPSIPEVKLTPETIQAAHKAGKLTQAEAVQLMEKYYTEELARTKTAKLTTQEVLEEGVKAEKPITEEEITQLAPKETPPVEAAPKTAAIQALEERVERTKVVVKDLREKAKFEPGNVGPIHQALQQAEKRAKAAGIQLSVARKTEGVEIPPVKPLTQLPTKSGVEAVIKAIPETGNAELDSMVKSLRAMRRRKGIDQFNDLETQAYEMLMKNIRNHPSLPPELREAWARAEFTEPPTTPIEVPPHAGVEKTTNIIPKERVSPDFIANLRKEGWEFDGLTDRGDYRFRKATEKPGLISRLAKSEKGELIIEKKAKKTPADILRTTPEGGVVLIKSGKAAPSVIKKLVNEGFKFVGENETGDLRFRKTTGGEPAPVLEEEVGLHRPTKKAIEQRRISEIGQFQNMQKSSIIAEAFNLPRGLLASGDFSAPLRQGLPLIHKKEFWRALRPMWESWKTEEGFRASQQSIANRALFKKRVDKFGEVVPSFADDAKLKLTDLTDLSSREEAIMSTWAESGGMFERNKWMAAHGGAQAAEAYRATMGNLVRRSNRAYVAFLNNLRADVFEALIRDGKIFNPGMEANLPLARGIADFVNTATGRGSLGKLEPAAVALNTGLFAPRLIASRVKILNPYYYWKADPFVRKEALKSLFAIAAAGNTVLALAKMMGAEVGTDPNSSDFGKAIIGNVRLDPWGGFQQYVVAANRLIRPSFAEVPGMAGLDTGFAPLDVTAGFLGTGGQRTTSSTSNQSYDLWNARGPYDPTHASIIGRFARGKVNPVIGFGWSIFAGMKEMSGQPMNFATLNPMDNAVMQRFIPILWQDLYEISQENPELLPFLGPPAALGMGVQQYGRVSKY